MIIRVAIIENNTDDVQHLVSLIMQWSDKHKKVEYDVYASGTEFLHKVAEVNSYHVIFIDSKLIQVFKMNFLIKLRKQLHYQHEIVITTSSELNHFAKMLIDINVLKYYRKS